MPRKRINIVSDTHLGSYGSSPDIFVNYLKNVSVDLLILNGDIYDVYTPKPDIDVEDIIKKNPKIKEYIFLKGNHDPNITQESYHISDNIIVFHGNQVDDKLFNFTKYITKIRYWVETTFNINIKILTQKYLYSLINWWLAPVQKKAISSYPGKIVIIGHTHIPKCQHPEYNSGALVDGVNSYLEVILENGAATITQKKFHL